MPTALNVSSRPRHLSGSQDQNIVPDHAITSEHRALLGRYLRPIAHMRQQSHHRRLCLIFGAGAGPDLGFPSWTELLERLGKSLPGYAAAKKSSATQASLAQSIVKLFEREFDRLNPSPKLSDAIGQRTRNSSLNAAWRNHVYDALYANVEKLDENAFVGSDCYFRAYVDVIKATALTITYNFDDSIERFLAKARSFSEASTRRGYTTVYDENSQLPTNSPVIYHPNGFLSHKKAEKPSTHLILSEDSFDAQLSDSITGRHAVIQSELSQKTCLIIGSSLQDPTFNFLLKKNAEHHPGHFHYYVHWSGENGENPASELDAEKLFDLYNLITLSLSTKEIKMLGDLLSLTQTTLRHKLREVRLDAQFVFIVTGAVGSGKSSVISHFRSLRQHDEWLEPRLEGMEKEVDKLSDETLERIDRWVDEQFALKNSVLHNQEENGVAVHILDRGPLDPLAFVKGNKITARASKLREAMTTRVEKVIVPSHVILLIADPKEMQIRALARGKDFSEAALSRQQEELRRTYGDSPGVTIIDTRGLTILQVVRRVAKVIHRDPYFETDLSTRLASLVDDPQPELPF
jgi:predicted ATPase